MSDDTPAALSKRYAQAVFDLEDAARGHLRGEDWDKEMIEALDQMRASRIAMQREAMDV